MSFKKYKNEFIVLFSLFLMVIAFLYKSAQVSLVTKETISRQNSVKELKEIVSLKQIWVDKRISKKIDKLKRLVPSSKVKWSKKGKKLTATYQGITANELNKLITKVLNLSLQIEFLKIQKNGLSYYVEFKCKW
jgi:hypothetical protein